MKAALLFGLIQAFTGLNEYDLIKTLAPRIKNPKRRYPEQSSRQALRGFRRAQGGPGICLNTTTMAYVPKAV